MLDQGNGYKIPQAVVYEERRTFSLSLMSQGNAKENGRGSGQVEVRGIGNTFKRR